MRSMPPSGMPLTLTMMDNGALRRSSRPSKLSPKSLMSNSRRAGERRSLRPSSTSTLTNLELFHQLNWKPPSRNTDTQTSVNSLPMMRNTKKARKARKERKERKEARKERKEARKKRNEPN